MHFLFTVTVYLIPLLDGAKIAPVQFSLTIGKETGNSGAVWVRALFRTAA